MFDWYRPKIEFKCPVCHTRLIEWQGKDAYCVLFVWKEGEISPIDQLVDDDIMFPASALLVKRLPEIFCIYSHDCGCPFPVMANCQCKDGVWSQTELITAENATQWKHERKSEFKKRLKWLQSGS